MPESGSGGRAGRAIRASAMAHGGSLRTQARTKKKRQSEKQWLRKLAVAGGRETAKGKGIFFGL